MGEGTREAAEPTPRARHNTNLKSGMQRGAGGGEEGRWGEGVFITWIYHRSTMVVSQATLRRWGASDMSSADHCRSHAGVVGECGGALWQCC